MPLNRRQVMGLAAAIAVSMYQGALTAFVGVPSFVVTLGGLMSFRGAAYLVADGKTQPLDGPGAGLEWDEKAVEIYVFS